MTAAENTPPDDTLAPVRLHLVLDDEGVPLLTAWISSAAATHGAVGSKIKIDFELVLGRRTRPLPA